MPDIGVNDFIELHNAIESLPKNAVSFRGERDINRPLRPKIGRYSSMAKAKFADAAISIPSLL